MIPAGADFAGVELGGCRLEGPLGRGAMGRVYRARQVALGRDVAIKLVVAGRGAAVTAERFEREARVVAAIEHPHVIPVYGAGEADGVLYLVMRLVEGEDLGALLARGALAPERAVALLGQVAGATRPTAPACCIAT